MTHTSAAPDPNRLARTTDSPHATFELGSRLGRALLSVQPEGATVALEGDLGAGKTTLTQGIAHGLGIRETVTSPTFTFINEYEVTLPSARSQSRHNRLRLFHIDLYRLPETRQAAAAEAGTFGLDEILDDAEAAHSQTVVIIEWAERIEGLLPTDHLHITLRANAGPAMPHQRQIELRASGPRSRDLLHALDRV